MGRFRFRAWDKDGGCMYKADEIGRISFDLDPFAITCLSNLGDIALFENYILMQSTGLKDRNGVEIFEGDVVESMSKVMNGAVVFNERNACFYWYNEACGNVPLSQLGVSYCEIIGNVYENPDLIKS